MGRVLFSSQGEPSAKRPDKPAATYNGENPSEWQNPNRRDDLRGTQDQSNVSRGHVIKQDGTWTTYGGEGRNLTDRHECNDGM